MEEQTINLNLNVHLRVSGDTEFEHETLKLLRQLLAKENQMAATLDQVLQDVTDETTAIASVSALIQGLKDQIAAGGLSAADQAKVDQVFANLESNKQKLADALAANVAPAP